jgi:hypothetical protein
MRRRTALKKLLSLPAAGGAVLAVGTSASASSEDLTKLLGEKLPAEDIRWLAENYGNTAVNVARKHGLQGAIVLRALGAQGVAVMRQHPDTFEQITRRIGGLAAAHLLIFNRKNFHEHAATGGLPRLLDLVENLPEPARKLGQRYPAMLPFLALSPAAATEALRRHPDLCLACFPFLDLSKGSESLTKVATLIEKHGSKARTWVEARGLDGILLTEGFSTFLGRSPPIPLPTFLSILSQNQDDLVGLLVGGHEEGIWALIGKLAEADERLPAAGTPASQPLRGSYIQMACTDARTLRFLWDDPDRSFGLLTDSWSAFVESGVSVPSLLYNGYRDKARENAREALRRVRPSKRGEVFRVLVSMADYPASLPELRHKRLVAFHRVVGRLDHRAVAYLGAAECDPDGADGRYKKLAERGFAELNEWEEPPSILKQSFPFYDTARLVWVMSNGYTPTQGELIFAGVELIFTAVDLATMGAGKAATAGVRAVGKKAVQSEIETLAKSIAPKAMKEVGKRGLNATVSGLAGRLATAPRVVKQVAGRKMFRDASVAASQAFITAARLNIPLILKEAGRFVVTQWGINLGIAGGIEGLTKLAELARNNDVEVFSEKTREALLAINRFLEKPVR